MLLSISVGTSNGKNWVKLKGKKLSLGIHSVGSFLQSVCLSKDDLRSALIAFDSGDTFEFDTLPSLINPYLIPQQTRYSSKGPFISSLGEDVTMAIANMDIYHSGANCGLQSSFDLESPPVPVTPGLFSDLESLSEEESEAEDSLVAEEILSLVAKCASDLKDQAVLDLKPYKVLAGITKRVQEMSTSSSRVASSNHASLVACLTSLDQIRNSYL